MTLFVRSESYIMVVWNISKQKPSRELSPARAFSMGKRRCSMPRKPKRPCSYPGCPELTDRRFCEEHAKKEAARYEKYDRDPATRKRYVVHGENT